MDVKQLSVLLGDTELELTATAAFAILLGIEVAVAVEILFRKVRLRRRRPLLCRHDLWGGPGGEECSIISFPVAYDGEDKIGAGPGHVTRQTRDRDHQPRYRVWSSLRGDGGQPLLSNGMMTSTTRTFLTP
jgi:hypothetical protein